MNGAKARIATVGAGRMGRGTAQVFAYAGHKVTIVDFKPRSAEALARLAVEVKAEIEGSFSTLADLGALDKNHIARAMALIDVVGMDAAGPVIAAADLVYENVPETREAKADALGRASRLARPDAIIASGTSTMLVTELQALVERPERFLNAHFLNPAFLIPLVEVSASSITDETVVKGLMALLEGAGKVPVRCAASPGYIVPRLQALLVSESARMVHEGVASAEDIDKAIRVGFGPRYTIMGPIEFIDFGGLDTAYYGCHYMAKALNSPRHAPPPELDRLMKEGKRGIR
ncbi:MAG: 3-hydroxyacyl-CoA dehydrogenase NAD-binding domain-containing protein, partial [Alphaproteobacteria bacterium]